MPSSIVFALSRHGDYHQPQGVPSAWLLHPLTELGRSQACRLGEALQKDAQAQGWQLDRRWDCSVLLRAWETASLAAGQWPDAESRPEIHSSPQLMERSVGSAANLTVEQIEEILEKDPRYARPAPGWKSVPSFRLPLPGAESLLEAGLRVAQYLRQCARDIEQQHSGSQTLVRVVVGHGASLRWAAHALGVLSMEEAKACSMYHAQSVYIERRSEHDWRHIGGEWKPRSRPAQD